MEPYTANHGDATKRHALFGGRWHVGRYGQPGAARLQHVQLVGPDVRQQRRQCGEGEADCAVQKFNQRLAGAPIRNVDHVGFGQVLAGVKSADGLQQRRDALIARVLQQQTADVGRAAHHQLPGHVAVGAAPVVHHHWAAEGFAQRLGVSAGISDCYQLRNLDQVQVWVPNVD